MFSTYASFTKSLKPSDLLPPSSGLRDRPSPPCEGDRDQRWSDPDRVARFRFVFLFFSFYYVISPFSLLSTTRSEGPESPPHHFLFRLSVPLPILSIWPCTVEICWRRWVTWVSIGISLSDRHGFVIPMEAETLYGAWCWVDIGFGEVFQLVPLSTLTLGLIF